MYFLFEAGRFYYKSGDSSKALRHLLKAASSGESDGAEALNLAIEVRNNFGSNLNLAPFDHNIFSPRRVALTLTFARLVH